MESATTRAALTDSVACPSGWFTLAVVRNGRLIERISGPNLIVAGAKLIQAGVVGGQRVAPGINTIGVGTSMTPPAYGNTALSMPFLKPVDGVTYPTPGQVTFAFSLANTEANGLSIGEFGLLAPDGTLFARKVRAFSLLVKDQTMSLSGTWTISFS